VDTPGQAVDLALTPGYAYVADESGGLRAIGLTPAPAELVRACDSAGHCTTVVGTTSSLFLAESTARVSLLNVPPVLDDLTPFAIQGEAVASASSLQALTVTVDGGLFYTATWPGGAFTQTLWTTPDWTPTEGPHQVAVTLTTWSGDVAVDVADVIVDTLPPAISIAPTVLTTTHYHPPLLNLTGLVTDVASLPDVVWRVGGGDWRPAAVVSNNWTGGWYLPGDTPDGTPYAVTAQATDIAGHTALVTQTVIVDLTPPAPVTLTLHSAGGLLEPGATLREPSPVITLTWTPQQRRQRHRRLPGPLDGPNHGDAEHHHQRPRPGRPQRSVHGQRGAKGLGRPHQPGHLRPPAHPVHRPGLRRQPLHPRLS
jgi:hypothetical protein